MSFQEHVPLAPLTTLHIGGPASVFIEAHAERDVMDAIECARDRKLPLYVLGAGSNILVPDVGVNGVVLKIALDDITYETVGNKKLLIAGAGALWENVVIAACERNLFGIENLAGIPGSAGGAIVQNIGAYGAELANIFEYADVMDADTGALKRITREEAAFAYRTSFFKQHREVIIIRVALCLSKEASPNITYPDLLRSREAGVPLTTPTQIAAAVRSIRAKKFPSETGEGTAGSFFKNPIISRSHAEALQERFPGLPAFPQGKEYVKISLAWILDHVLSLKGFTKGSVRLYEGHSLVVVVRHGATAADVNAFASEISARVLAATGIAIEREVEIFGSC